MAIGTTAAIIMGASAIGGHLAKAKLESNAANKAAKSQIAASNQAIPIQQDVYRTQMAGMQPYANLGSSAAGTLGRLMSPGMPYTPQLQRQDAAVRPMQGQSSLPMPGADVPDQAMPRPGTTPRPSMAGGMAPSRIAPQQAPGGMPGAMVQLRAPDGSVQAVPESMAGAFVARGAVRV